MPIVPNPDDNARDEYPPSHSDTCPACKGSGHDPTGHKWPDGTPAACEACDGYGDTSHRSAPEPKF